MNKTELVAAITKETKQSAKDVAMTLDASLEIIGKTLKKKQDVRLTGFGTFSVSRSKARKGRNPATGEAIKIKASNRASFKSGKTLKDRLN